MARTTPTFKVHVNLTRHPKTHLLNATQTGYYVRLGMLAVERFAGKNGDSFIATPGDLKAVFDASHLKTAIKRLENLTEFCPISAGIAGEFHPISGQYPANSWRIHIPNLAKKQGFHPTNSYDPCSSESELRTPNSDSEKKETRARDGSGLNPDENSGLGELGAKFPPNSKPADPPKPKPKKRAAKSPQVPIPLEDSTEWLEIVGRLEVWTLTNEITSPQLTFGLDAIRRWAESGDQRKARWYQACQGYLKAGWPLKGFGFGQPGAAAVPKRRTQMALAIEEDRDREQRRADQRALPARSEAPSLGVAIPDLRTPR